MFITVVSAVTVAFEETLLNISNSNILDYKLVLFELKLSFSLALPMVSNLSVVIKNRQLEFN